MNLWKNQLHAALSCINAVVVPIVVALLCCGKERNHRRQRSAL